MRKTFFCIIFKCLTAAILTILFANIIALFVEIFNTNLSESWTISYQKLTFYVNNKAVGLIWNESNTIFFMLIVFAVSMYREYVKGNFYNNHAQ